MIKAAMITPNLTMGGAERWIATMIKHSDPEQLQWTGVACSGFGGMDANLCKEISDHGCRITAEKIRLNEGKPTPGSITGDNEYVERFPTMKEACKAITEDADVIVTWGLLACRALKRDDKQPAVLVSHNSHYAARPIGPGITHLAAVSLKAAETLQHKKNPHVTTIYNGVDMLRIKPTKGRLEIRKHWGAGHNTKVIGYVGRLSNEKNPNAAALAVEAARLHGHDWMAVYYGETPPLQRPPAPDHIGRIANALPGRVLVYAPIAQVGNVYCGLDALMLASDVEACSLTMLEAWMCDVPVISTPVGALPEMEEMLGMGALAAPVDWGLRKQREHLLTAAHDAILHRESYNGRVQLIRGRFSADVMMRRWEGYLNLVVAGEETPDGVLWS